MNTCYFFNFYFSFYFIDPYPFHWDPVHPTFLGKDLFWFFFFFWCCFCFISQTITGFQVHTKERIGSNRPSTFFSISNMSPPPPHFVIEILQCGGGRSRSTTLVTKSVIIVIVTTTTESSIIFFFLLLLLVTSVSSTTTTKSTATESTCTSVMTGRWRTGSTLDVRPHRPGNVLRLDTTIVIDHGRKFDDFPILHIGYG